MKKYRFTDKVVLICLGICTTLALLSVTVYKITENFPEFVTRYYSNGLFNIITIAGKWIAGFFSFSLGEILLLCLTAVILTAFIYSLIKTFLNFKKKHPRPCQPAFRFISLIIVLAELALTVFIWGGGLNYNGMTIYDRLNLSEETYSAQELYNMTTDYIEKANALREKLPETEAGNLLQEYDFTEITELALEAYINLPEKYSKLLATGYFTKAKPAMLSSWMCYTNITGIYPYIVPEPIINIKIPATSMASTICHEMAHQRAIAREDEANFISFLTCTSSDNIYFQYSGYYLAVMNCLNSLYSVNFELWSEAWKHMSEEMKSDISYSSKFWEQYSTKIGEFSEKVNDTYLQANNIKDGVASYGRLTDLLLADYYSSVTISSVGTG